MIRMLVTMLKVKEKKEVAYSTHAYYDNYGYIVDFHLTPSNVHDSTQLVPQIAMVIVYIFLIQINVLRVKNRKKLSQDIHGKIS